MSEQQDQQPVFSIEKIYVKDLSLEIPHAPQVFLGREQPEIDMQLGTGAQLLAVDGILAVHDQRQRIDLFAVHHHVELDQVGGLEALEFVVERSIAAARGFQLVKEVHHHFVHRQVVGQHHLPAHVLHVDLHAALLVAQRHHGTDIVLRHQDGGSDDRLADFLDLGRVRQFRGVFHLDDRTILQQQFVHHGRCRGDEVHVELAFEALLHDFEVQEAEEAAAEAITSVMIGSSSSGTAAINLLAIRE